MPTIESLLTVEQVARLTGLSPETILRLIDEQRTPEPVNVAGAVRLRASEVDRWIKLGCPERSALGTANEAPPSSNDAVVSMGV